MVAPGRRGPWTGCHRFILIHRCLVGSLSPTTGVPPSTTPGSVGESRDKENHLPADSCTSPRRLPFGPSMHRFQAVTSSRTPCDSLVSLVSSLSTKKRMPCSWCLLLHSQLTIEHCCPNGKGSSRKEMKELFVLDKHPPRPTKMTLKVPMDRWSNGFARRSMTNETVLFPRSC